MRLIVITTSTAMATVLAVGGCGGAHTTNGHREAANGVATVATASHAANKGSPVRAPLARQALITKADQICYRVNAKRATTRITSNQSATQALPELAAYEQAALSELKKLTPPVALEHDWRTILTLTGTVAHDTAKLAGFVNTNPHMLEGQPLLAEIVRMQQQIATIARHDGFEDCARTS